MKDLKVRDYTCRICLNINGKIYKLFIIWYHNDWWYFISDVGWKKENNYMVFKITNKNQDNPKNQISKILLSKPKLSHHIDWNVHVSWKNIISWFNESGEWKWISVKSFDLRVGSKRWPLLWFYLDSEYLKLFNHFEFDDKTIEKPHLIIWEKSFMPFFECWEIFQICVEWYYIHKKEVPSNIFDHWYHTWIIIFHPLYWNISLTPIFSPQESPYIIWLLFYKKPLVHSPLKFSDKAPFVFWWWPWEIWKNWIWHSINIVYDNWLHDAHFTDTESLNYKK